MQKIRDNEFDKLKDLVSRHFSPNIFVSASEKAKTICHQNLLTPAEFLRPFGFFKEANLRYRSLERERPLSSNSFHLNFVDATEFESPKKEMIDKQIKDLIMKNAPERPENLTFHSKTREGLAEEICRTEAPWFDKVTDTMFAYTKNHFEMNFLDHPWAAVYMITSKETDPVQEVRRQINENASKLNAIFANSATDLQNLPRIVLVLYEFSFEENSKLELAQKIVAKLQGDLSYVNTKLIIINTAEDDRSHEVWANHLYHTYYYPRNQIDYINNEETIRGKKIPKNDRDLLRNNIYEIFIKQILPYIETKIRALDIVTAKKKGLTNAFKKFFTGNTKVDYGNRYTLNQDESCLRNLADTFFLLEDYENAIGNYKLFASEVKGKSSKYHGNALEMINLCVLFTERGQSRKDTSFRKCYDQYMETIDGVKFGARTVLLHVYHCILANSREENLFFLDAGKKLYEELPILNSILYEQYALMYLRTDPIWPRKYAFSMVLAGHTYNTLNLRKYGQRCYYLANVLYNTISWKMIQEHLNSTLGKNSFQNGEALDSIRYFRNALENISQNDTPERHSALIKEAFSVIAQVQSEQAVDSFSPESIANYYEEITKFPFPKINDEGFDISIEDDNFNFMNDKKSNKVFTEGVTQHDFILNADSEQLWYNMGKRLAAFVLKRPEVSRLDPYEELSLKMMDCVYISDKIKLLERMPREAFLDEDIIINVRVDNPYKVPLEIKEFRLEYEDEQDLLSGDVNNGLSESKKENFVLTELEQKHVQIVIRPSKEGIIKVKGVRWKIDCIEGKHDFKFKKPYTSQIRVLPSLGKVIFAIDGLKNQLCYGEINKCRLNIANTSRVAIDKVFLINSYPEMFGFESKELGSLQAGSTIEVPFLARGSITKIYEVRFLLKVYYVTGKVRYFRIVFPIEVQNSFIPKYFTTPCFDKRIIGLQFDEMWSPSFSKQLSLLDRSDSGLSIEQVILLTGRWKLVDTGMHKPIYRKQDNFLHCYVERCPTDVTAQEEEKNYRQLKLKENVNLLQISNDKEAYISFDNLIDFYNLTYKRFKTQALVNKSLDQEKVSLALLWKYTSDAGVLHGVQFLYQIPLNSNTSLSSRSHRPSGPKLMFDELPLQFRVIVPPKIQHNFNIHPSCTVAVKLKLSNVVSSQVLTFRVEALNSDHSVNNRDKLGSKYFVWEGVTDLQIEDLKPMNNCTIDLNVVFFEPGVYDLSKFRFKFYRNKRTGEIAKNVSPTEEVNAQNFDFQTFTSEKDQCLIEISS